MDSCYNVLHFSGQAKINESAVKLALNLLDHLCAATDSTILYLWHPSQAGIERGDNSGWSVAWHNTPRARLSITPADKSNDAYELKVEKRNNSRVGERLTLHWHDGCCFRPQNSVARIRVKSFWMRALSWRSRQPKTAVPSPGKGSCNTGNSVILRGPSGFTVSNQDVKEQLERAVYEKKAALHERLRKTDRRILSL